VFSFFSVETRYLYLTTLTVFPLFSFYLFELMTVGVRPILFLNVFQVVCLLEWNLFVLWHQTFGERLVMRMDWSDGMDVCKEEFDIF